MQYQNKQQASCQKYNIILSDNFTHALSVGFMNDYDLQFRGSGCDHLYKSRSARVTGRI